MNVFRSLMLLIGLCVCCSVCADEHPLERLLKGNDRYVHDAMEHPNRNRLRRDAIASKQMPFAIIVGCADSRVSPEIIFDQGIGDLFVVRVAGNVIGPLELDSIDYSALYLNSSIILVLGHENCGAVTAVLNGQTKDIESVAELIQPAVNAVKKTNPPNPIETAIKYNAIRMKHYLLNSPIIGRLVSEKKLEVYAAYYHLQTGAVEILKD